ncbi:hypothetical protein ES703_74669 [subsurface metagenome]
MSMMGIALHNWQGQDTSVLRQELPAPTEKDRLELELAETRRLTKCKILEKCPDPRWKLIRDETIEHKGQVFNRKLWVAICGGAVEYTEGLVEGKRVYTVERFELYPSSWAKEKVIALPCSQIVSDRYDIPEEAMDRVKFHKESITPFWWKVKKGEMEVKMEELTLVTEEKEYEPGEYEPGYSNSETAAGSNPGERIMTKEQMRERIEELEAKVYFEEKLSDEEERELAELIRKIGSNPGEPIICSKCGSLIYRTGERYYDTPEGIFCYHCVPEIYRTSKYEKIHKPIHSGEPLHEPSPGFSNFHTLMLHAVAEMYGPGGIVVDEAKAKATPCSCTEYKPGKFWCTSKGVVGALTDKQEGLYCNPREIVERPGIKERMTKWGEAVEFCRGQLPPTDGRTRLEIYLDCMSKELTKAGIEA